jgi:8-oxo-dGTP pyrophosphatase MutT (NUDIX family)
MPKSAQPKHQVGALPVRKIEGELEICLVTTRETRRWTIPKGWPMRGRKDWAAAEVEAIEEAGLVGKMSHRQLGSFLYWKRRLLHLTLVKVAVYRLDVTDQLPTWKEASERDVRWFSAIVASEMVEEPGLAAMIKTLDKKSS